LSAQPIQTATAHPEPLAAYPAGATKCLTVLSRLLFDSDTGETADSSHPLNLEPDELDKLLALADSHHVVIRALQPFQRLAEKADRPALSAWASSAIQREHIRIENALTFLEKIFNAFKTEGCSVMVIKSLDHWPDLGSDLDLFSPAKPTDVIRTMKRHFNATLAPRSWGDRLANKWNFVIPGLNELVEVHVGRLGQTGEHTAIAKSLIGRSRSLEFGWHRFQVTAPEDRLILSTLQRMYRHFYLRLCDVADTACLMENDPIDYGYLHSATEAAGIWKGTATFLAIVSDYLAHYRSRGLDLPEIVRSAAQFGGEQLTFQRFLRIPIMPHSVRLYTSQLSRLALRGEVEGTLRLSLLPYLATAAVIEQKITGSDKGVW